MTPVETVTALAAVFIVGGGFIALAIAVQLLIDQAATRQATDVCWCGGQGFVRLDDEVVCSRHAVERVTS